jgi:hypothetical protein
MSKKRQLLSSLIGKKVMLTYNTLGIDCSRPTAAKRDQIIAIHDDMIELKGDDGSITYVDISLIQIIVI